MITRPMLREPQVIVEMPRPESSTKNAGPRATYEPAWWKTLKSRMSA